jgi:hypothetical protein
LSEYGLRSVGETDPRVTIEKAIESRLAHEWKEFSEHVWIRHGHDMGNGPVAHAVEYRPTKTTHRNCMIASTCRKCVESLRHGSVGLAEHHVGTLHGIE